MLLLLYRLVTLLLAFLVLIVTLRERSLGRQVSGALVLVPLLLRVLLVK